MLEKFLPKRQELYETHNTINPGTVRAPGLPQYLENASELMFKSWKEERRLRIKYMKGTIDY